MTALLRHSTTVYDALDASANEEKIGKESVRIFRGSITKLYRGLSISMGYYSNIFDALEENGAITKLQQGARGVDSIFILHQRPDEGTWTEEGLGSPLTEDGEYAKLTQRIENLERSLGGMIIVEALANHEERLAALEVSKPKTRGKADKA